VVVAVALDPHNLHGLLCCLGAQDLHWVDRLSAVEAIAMEIEEANRLMEVDLAAIASTITNQHQ